MPADRGIAAVVLAAGGSRRFGADNKLLAELGGRSLIARVIEALVEAGIDDIVVVTGHEADAVSAAVTKLPVRIAHNPHWEEGMGTSIAAGVEALGDDVPGALIVPGDMPFLSGGLVSALAASFVAADGERIVYPVTRQGEQRNPVLWPRSFFVALTRLPPDTGAKQMLERHADESLAVAAGDEHEFEDIDTPEALAAARGA